MTQCTWLFGRRASIANGLSWIVPDEWKQNLVQGNITKNEHIEMIKDSLRKEMQNIPLPSEPYRSFIDFIANKIHKIIK